MDAPATDPTLKGHRTSTPIRIQLLTFFVAAFLISWAAWIPAFITPSRHNLIALIGLFAPALAAVSTAAIYGGGPCVREIFRRLTIVRFPLQWALLSVLMMPLIYLTSIAILRALHVPGTESIFTGSSPLFLLGSFAWLVLVTAGEEIGWRGYALPRLLEDLEHPVLVSMGFGFVWGLWHLPLYLLPGQSAFPLPLFLIFTSLQAILYTVLFIESRGSLLPALLLHAGTDIAPRIFLLVHLPRSFWMIVNLLLAAVTMTLLIALRPLFRNLQRLRALINVQD